MVSPKKSMPETELSGRCSANIPIQSSLPDQALSRLLHMRSAISDALDDQGPLTVELIGIPFMAFFLTVLQPTAFVILQHAMFAAKMSLAEGTIPNDALRLILAVLESTTDLLWSAAAYRKCDIDSGVWWERRQRRGW